MQHSAKPPMCSALSTVPIGGRSATVHRSETLLLPTLVRHTPVHRASILQHAACSMQHTTACSMQHTTCSIRQVWDRRAQERRACIRVLPERGRARRQRGAEQSRLLLPAGLYNDYNNNNNLGYCFQQVYIMIIIIIIISATASRGLYNNNNLGYCFQQVYIIMII
jgi:hypothetical protein